MEVDMLAQSVKTIAAPIEDVTSIIIPPLHVEN